MLGQVSQFLDVNSNNFPFNENIIIGDRSYQGGFLIHYFLNLCQKQTRPVLLIGLSQSLSHYRTVSQKLGHKDGGEDYKERFIFIDGLHLLGESTAPRTATVSDNNPFLHLLRGDSTSLFDLIRASFETLVALAETDAPPVVVIDDLSILHSAGVPTRDLLLLINRILELVTSGTTKGSLVTLFHLDKEDEKAEEIWAFLTHLSTLQIEVSDLQSGYCKDVHGQVQAQWHDAHDKPRLSVTKHAQFKLSDKGIDLFAAGMSAAVL